MWSFEVQLILQIICNRIAMIEMNRRRAKWLKWAVFFTILCINISVFCIWVPARMQVSEGYMHLNDIWDRIEKVLYLFIDLALNIYFVRTVKKKLVNNGLRKYDKLVKFNIRIIFISLAMDVSTLNICLNYC